MNPRQEAAQLPAVRPLGYRQRVVAACLAVHAVLVPLLLSAIAAAGAGALPEPLLGTLALGASLVGPGLAAILACWRGLGAVGEDIAQRGDGEPAQAVFRIFIAGAALLYLGGLAAIGVPVAQLLPMLVVTVAGILCAWLFFAHVMIQPGGAAVRRVVALAGDIGFVSAFLHSGEALAAPWVGAYLCISIGFGLRFGVPALAGATALCTAAFAAVVAASPFWRELPAVAAGVATALVILPFQAATMIRRLAAAHAEAAASRVAKTRLLAVMSHELRTPLDTLIGTAGRLARSRLDAGQRDLLGAMELSARTLLGLIDDLLDLAKAAAGKRAPKAESFVLHELLGGAVAMLRPQAEAKGLALALAIDPRLPHTYRGPALQLRQVLTNLLVNAIKFTPRGSIAVAASLAGQTAGGVRLRLAVRDDGIGIPAAAKERIFASFAQADDSVSGRFGGSGLGLAIAKEIVEAIGGTIAVESQVGAGSVFTVELPLACDVGAVLRPPDLVGRQIVVVGPDAALAEELQARLRSWRGEPQWYQDGEDALMALSSARGPARSPVVLLDGRADPLAGLSLAHRLATRLPHRPPVILIAPVRGGEAIAGLAAPQLAAVIEAPVSEAALASAFLNVLAGDLHGAASEAAPAPAAASPALRVLAADDSAASREILKGLLGAAGYQVELASDGGAALAALEKSRFDLALLDINMPGLSGDGVARLHRLRRQADRRLPIIALTADATGVTEQRCREAGMAAVLTKPIEAAALFATIDELLAREAMPMRMAVGASPMVTPILSHPRFLADSAEVVHEATVEALRNLGGNEFVAEVVASFRSDAARLIDNLRPVIEQADPGAFAELVHSLRSGAANVGGVRLCQMLTTLKDVTVRDLRQAGGGYLEKIENELARLEVTLEQIVRSERPA